MGGEELECEKKSREFQDAIFRRCVANPLVFPLVYRIMRDEFEKQAQAGADRLAQVNCASRRDTKAKAQTLCSRRLIHS